MRRQTCWLGIYKNKNESQCLTVFYYHSLGVSWFMYTHLCACVCVCVSWLSVFFSPPPCALLCRISDVFMRVARRQWEPVHRLAETDNNLYVRWAST